MILWFESHHTWGSLLRGCSIRKVENHLLSTKEKNTYQIQTKLMLSRGSLWYLSLYLMLFACIRSYIAQTGLELMISQPQPPMCCNYSHVLLCLTSTNFTGLFTSFSGSLKIRLLQADTATPVKGSGTLGIPQEMVSEHLCLPKFPHPQVHFKKWYSICIFYLL